MASGTPERNNTMFKEVEKNHRIVTWKAALREIRILLIDERNCKHEYSKEALIDRVLQISNKYFGGNVFIQTNETFHDALARPRFNKEPKLMWKEPKLKGI